MAVNPANIKLKTNIEELIDSESQHIYSGIIHSRSGGELLFIKSVIRRVATTCLAAGYNEGFAKGAQQAKDAVSDWIANWQIDECMRVKSRGPRK